MSTEVDFLPSTACPTTAAAYAYVAKTGERVLVASYTPDIHTDIDAANGWLDPTDSPEEPNNPSLHYPSEVASFQKAVRFVFEMARLDTYEGVKMAIDRFMALVVWSGTNWRGCKDGFIKPPFDDPSNHQFVLKVLANSCQNVQTWNDKSKLRAYTRFLCTVWLVSPQSLTAEPNSGKTLSLDALASPMGYSKCWLSMVAEEIGKSFKIHSRNQKRQSSRGNYAEATKAAWEKRKQPFTNLVG